MGFRSALNLARFWPDCDMTQVATRFDWLFSSFLSCFLAKISSISYSFLAVHHREKREKVLHFPSFNLCSNLEISPMVLETTPYKCVFRRFKAFGGVIFEREALSC